MDFHGAGPHFGRRAQPFAFRPGFSLHAALDVRTLSNRKGNNFQGLHEFRRFGLRRLHSDGGIIPLPNFPLLLRSGLVHLQAGVDCLLLNRYCSTIIV